VLRWPAVVAVAELLPYQRGDLAHRLDRVEVSASAA